MKPERAALAVVVCAANACSVALDWDPSQLTPIVDAAADRASDATVEDAAVATDACGAALDRDPLNCGRCGLRCGASQVCASGVCVGGGRTPLTSCGDQCVDLLTSPRNCGACGTVFQEGMTRCCRGTRVTRCP